MSLEDVRARNTNGMLDKLIKAASRTSRGKTSYNNDQEEKYYPERDKNGNGSCIIRFLPGLESEGYPYYIERFQHGFSHNNKWYIEMCPSTIDKECPVCNDGFDLIGEYGKWDDCPKDVQALLRKRGRTTGFKAGNYCNILVIKDPANPENEGKVHLFSFGKGIVNMIFDMAQPQDDGLGTVPDPIDVFNLETGANFKFIIRKKDERADYSKSSFEAPSPCPEFDADTQYALEPLKDEKLFKDYEELEDRYNKVLNNRATRRNANDVVADDVGSKSSSESNNSKNNKVDNVDSDSGSVDGSVDDKDNMAYFNNIADELKI